MAHEKFKFNNHHADKILSFFLVIKNKILLTGALYHKQCFA